MIGTNRTKGIAMLVFTALAWGAMFTIAKRALETIDAFHVTALRYVPAAAVMLAILASVEGLQALRPGPALLRLWLLGTLGFGGFSILGFLGIAGSTPEHAAIIVALMPLVSALMLWLLRGMKPSPTTLVTTAVALVGVVLVVTRGHFALAGSSSWHADALVLAGVVCWVAYTAGASTLPELSVLRYTALSMALGTLSIVVAALAASQLGVVPALDWHRTTGLVEELAYLSLVSSVGAVLAWNAGIAALGPASGVLFINLVPVTAFVVGVVQGHRFGVTEVAGGALTVAALAANAIASHRAAGRTHAGIRATHAAPFSTRPAPVAVRAFSTTARSSPKPCA